MKTTTVSIAQLGLNCWSAKRFFGGDCGHINGCKYPEKKECKAFKDIRVYEMKRVYAKDKPA